MPVIVGTETTLSDSDWDISVGQVQAHSCLQVSCSQVCVLEIIMHNLQNDVKQVECQLISVIMVW